MTDDDDDNPYPFGLDGAHAGWTCSNALRFLRDQAPKDTLPSFTPEEMRAYIESAPDRVDWKSGYAIELAEVRRRVPGPQDELARASRFVVKELGNMMPETPLGAWEQAGLPLVLHPGVGRSPTYELVARSLAKHYLAILDDHPEAKAFRFRHLNFHDDENLIEDHLPVIRRPDLRASGFQVGWALNAARFVQGWGPTPNPAMVRVAGDDEDDAKEVLPPGIHELPHGAGYAIVDHGTGKHD